MSEAKDIIKPTAALLAELRGMIAEARGQVAQATNVALTTLYWKIGQRLHRDILKEKRADYGKRIVASLGRHLTAEFGAGKKEEQIELLELGHSGIHVAEYLTALPPRELLQQKLHDAIKISQARLEAKKREIE